MLRPFFSSFATRLSVYIISFTVIVFAILTFVFYSYSQQKITNYAIQHTHGLLSNMASKIDGQLSAVETTIQQSIWMLEENCQNPEALHKIIHSVVKNNDFIFGSGIAFEPGYFNDYDDYFMLYASANNGLISTQHLGGKNYDYPCMDWYLIPKLLKTDYWSEPYYDTGGGNFIMSTFSHPLCDKDGNVYAVFTANISLSSFTNMVDSLTPYESSHSFLLSRNGSYLTHPERVKIMNETIFSNAYENEDTTYERLGKEMIAGHTGTIQFEKDNKAYYAFYTVIPNIGWSVCNICPADVILKELHTSSRKLLILSLIAISLLFLITYYIIKKTVHPLEDFSKSAREIATGHFDVQLPDVTSRDEIKDLHDSLEFMQHSLSSYITELKTTTATKERIESELSIAHEIQMGMIPKTFPPFPDRNNVDLHAILKSAKEVGGDLYDFFINDEKLYFAIGDVSGKGVPASLFMAITRSLFQIISAEDYSPSEIITRMNDAICENNESSMFVTLIVGMLDLSDGKLKLCNAGHNPPLIIHPNGEVEIMNIHSNLFVGIMKNQFYKDNEFTLEEGAKLFLYTDGVTEAENKDKALYSDELLLRTITEHAALDIKELINRTTQSIAQHVQDFEQSDDLTMLAIHYKSKSNNHEKRS